MPNHTQCKMVLKGSKKDLDAFLKKAKAIDSHGKMKDFSLNAFVPMPDHIYRGNLGQEEKNKYGEENCWYDWSINNWGTKWECYEVAAGEIDNNTLVILFQTAWSPPMPVIDKIVEMFPQLEFSFSYIDEGMGFAGTHGYKNGEEGSVEYYQDWNSFKEQMKAIYLICHGYEFEEYEFEEYDEEE